MLYALLALNLIALIVLLALTILLLRKSPPAPAADAVADPRLTQLLAADLPTQFTRLDAHFDGLNQHLRAELAAQRGEFASQRSELATQRSDAAADALRSREASDAASAALRGEVLATIGALGDKLQTGLDGFRSDNASAAERLRSAVDAQLKSLGERLTSFTADSTRQSAESREALHTRLNQLSAAQAEHQEKLRAAVEARLDALNQSNEAKLEQMRLTVDEKLHATLQSRLTESFGAVTDQLTKVHAGLGEMNALTTGVNDLNRLFSNVKSRGGFAEVQLGKLLDQVLAPGQFVANANVRPGTQEVVEYAVRFPGSGGDVLLPIDAKFPREDWERLESAYETSDGPAIDAARRAFDAAIRTEARRICSKYINEPITTPYAIMFLPTEGLYAEVLRRDGLQAELHQSCRVMVAGPTNLYALLTSFQLGFRMLNLQKKGSEVWHVLGKAKTEFETFGTLMTSMEKQVGTVQNTIQKLNVRTRAINKTLLDVAEVDAGDAKVLSFDGYLPMLAASEPPPGGG